MTPFEDTEDDAPLDPAAARLRAKLVRLLFISGGIMMLGFIAVFAAIVYKLNESGHRVASGTAPGSPVEANVAIPPGYRVATTALDGDRALLTLVAPDGTTLLLFIDLTSGAALGRYQIQSAP